MHQSGPITVAGQSLERAQNVYTTLQLENMNVRQVTRRRVYRAASKVS
jgi:hypothetical protein